MKLHPLGAFFYRTYVFVEQLLSWPRVRCMALFRSSLESGGHGSLFVHSVRFSELSFKYSVLRQLFLNPRTKTSFHNSFLNLNYYYY